MSIKEPSNYLDNIGILLNIAKIYDKNTGFQITLRVGHLDA